MLGIGMTMVKKATRKLSDWILSNGFWEDQKKWIDTETWKD